MSRDRKLPKTNSSLLPSINYRNVISLIILSLVTSTASSAQYDCPNSCECDEATFSARCDDLSELIASYSQKQHKSRHNFMPIKSLDLSNSKLTKLTHQLEVLVNITELNLSHNQLTQVNKLNFAQLETLDLSHNRITSAKLKKLPKNVVHLNLAHNEITYLPVDFMKLKALRSLELTGNPLNCTCNTLHVRNWMTYHHVRSDNPILCTSPVIVKGQPWLQARQNDICIEPSSTTTQRSKYNWDNYEDDNEIMMGDQPQADEPKADEDIEYEDEEENEDKADEAPEDDPPAADDDAPAPAPAEDEDKTESKDVFADDDSAAPEKKVEKSADDVSAEDEFIPINEPHESSTIEPEAVSKPATDLEDNYDEGSGGVILPLTSEQPEEEGDESGSGMLPILIPTKEDLSAEDASVGTLGIFEDNTESPVDAHSGLINAHDAETEAVNKELTSQESGDLKTASTDDNTGTYVLLGILALCLISLMIFVAMKNKQEKRRKTNRYDVEKHGATELQDMEKGLLGKPLDKNGNGKAPEHTPLINEDRPKAYTSFQAPSINVDAPVASPRENGKSQQSLYENHPNGNGNIEPVHQSNGSLGKTPESEDELYHPAVESPTSLNVSPEPPKRYSPIYTPASPRSERYSPVYSPETGRVKIKLTETPKPKTPIVVTRSRSRAGEYVNTLN